MSEPLVVECSDRMAQILDALVLSGMFGHNRESAAQRLLELKIWEIAMQMYGEKKL